MNKLKLSILKSAENNSLEEVHGYLKVLGFPTDSNYAQYSLHDYLSQSIMGSSDEGKLKELALALRNVRNPTERVQWREGYYKMFLSHKSEYKEDVKEIKTRLLDYGVHCFIAHEDITISTQWRDMIIDGLKSCDGFLAYITDDFEENSWCLQESGYACVNGLNVIPLKVETKNPTGILAAYQAANVANRTGIEIAKIVAELLLKQRYSEYIAILLSCLKVESNYSKTKYILELLADSKVKLPKYDLDQLVEIFNTEDQVHGYYYAKDRLNMIAQNSGSKLL